MREVGKWKGEAAMNGDPTTGREDFVTRDNSEQSVRDDSTRPRNLTTPQALVASAATSFTCCNMVIPPMTLFGCSIDCWSYNVAIVLMLLITPPFVHCLDGDLRARVPLSSTCCLHTFASLPSLK
jgi:hypothetical protein